MTKEKRKRWRKISGDRVRLRYKHGCGCGRRHNLVDELCVSIAFLDNSGTPICCACGNDMKYVCSEVKV
jgi:hypothetical protein